MNVKQKTSLRIWVQENADKWSCYKHASQKRYGQTICPHEQWRSSLVRCNIFIFINGKKCLNWYVTKTTGTLSCCCCRFEDLPTDNMTPWTEYRLHKEEQLTNKWKTKTLHDQHWRKFEKKGEAKIWSYLRKSDKVDRYWTW